MSFDKNEIMNWSAEEKRNLAFELLDSIDEAVIQQEQPAWKIELIKQRIENDNASAIDDVVAWKTLREKYKH